VWRRPELRRFIAGNAAIRRVDGKILAGIAAKSRALPPRALRMYHRSQARCAAVARPIPPNRLESGQIPDILRLT
jgi:hypothetical protein